MVLDPSALTNGYTLRGGRATARRSKSRGRRYHTPNHPCGVGGPSGLDEGTSKQVTGGTEGHGGGAVSQPGFSLPRCLLASSVSSRSLAPSHSKGPTPWCSSSRGDWHLQNHRAEWPPAGRPPLPWDGLWGSPPQKPHAGPAPPAEPQAAGIGDSMLSPLAQQRRPGASRLRM